MSSIDVRNKVKLYFNTNWSETIVDMSGESREIRDLLSDEGLSSTDVWIGLQFIGSSEEMISTPKGCYRESGSISIHVVAPISSTAIDDILLRCKTIRSLFRGRRIDEIIIESVSPPNTEVGTTIDFEANFTSASFFIDYYADIKE